MYQRVGCWGLKDRETPLNGRLRESWVAGFSAWPSALGGRPILPQHERSKTDSPARTWTDAFAVCSLAEVGVVPPYCRWQQGSLEHSQYWVGQRMATGASQQAAGRAA